MDRGIEKSGTDNNWLPASASIFDALAVVSVLVILSGASLSIFQASWRIRAYFSIVAVLFDLILAYEFLQKLAARRKPFAWLDGLSSILPLLIISGPFIFGWAAADFRAAAVRGFWLSDSPVNSIAFLAALRMLRVFRFYRIAQKDPLHDTGRLRTAWTAALATGLFIIIAGALASDAFLFPGIARLAADRRASLASTILAAQSDEARQAAAKAAGVLALEVDGRALLTTPAYVYPADYHTYTHGNAIVWFPVNMEVRARGLVAAVAALASLAAAFAFRIAASGHFSLPGINSGLWRRRSRAGGNADKPPQRFRDAPTGDEELAGILGKRPR
jgi:hypothetical protein